MIWRLRWWLDERWSAWKMRRRCNHCGLTFLRGVRKPKNGMCDVCTESRSRRARLIESGYWNTNDYWKSVGHPHAFKESTT